MKLDKYTVITVLSIGFFGSAFVWCLRRIEVEKEAERAVSFQSIRSCTELSLTLLEVIKNKDEQIKGLVKIINEQDKLLKEGP